MFPSYYPGMDYDAYGQAVAPVVLPRPPPEDFVWLYMCDKCGCTYSKGTCPEHGRKP